MSKESIDGPKPDPVDAASKETPEVALKEAPAQPAWTPDEERAAVRKYVLLLQTVSRNQI